MADELLVENPVSEEKEDRKAKRKAAAKRQGPGPAKVKPVKSAEAEAAPEPRREPAQAELPFRPAVPPIFAAVTTAIDALREGIAARDWLKVEEAYRGLTGEAPPLAISGNPAAILLAIARLVQGWDGGESSDEYPPRTPLPSFSGRTEGLGDEGQANEFVDDLSVNAAEARKSRRLSERMRGRERETRGAYEPIRLTCGTCGKAHEVNPALRPVRAAADDDAPEFRCNDCLTGRSRAR